MVMTENVINNSQLDALRQQAGPRVTAAIQKASVRTGVDFSYLMKQAAAESSFDPEVKATTSSATGLYQFIDKTWMNMVRDHGSKHGLQEYAQAIDRNGNVSDPVTRQEILELRKDPQTASVMAAEFASSNKNYLERYAGLEDTDIGTTELYFAHFMGAGGASAFLKANEDTPLARAADLFPREARANRNVFYDPQSGEARTIAQVYDLFDKKFGDDYNAAPASQTSPQTTLAQSQNNQKAYSIHPQEYFRPLASHKNTALHNSQYTAMLQGSSTMDVLQFGDTQTNDAASDTDIWQQAMDENAALSIGFLKNLTTNPVETMILANLTHSNASNTRTDSANKNRNEEAVYDENRLSRLDFFKDKFENAPSQSL